MHRTPISDLRWPGLSRRTFLKGLLGAAGSIGAGASITACSEEGGIDAGGRPLLFLDEGEASILTALGEAIIPSQPPFPSLAQARVIRRIDEEISFVDEAIRSDVHAAIGALQWAPFLYGRFSRYARLDVEGRREVLTCMMQGGSETLRAVAANLKILIHFFYFAHPSAWRAMGYDGTFGRLPQRISEQRAWYARKTGSAT